MATSVGELEYHSGGNPKKFSCQHHAVKLLVALNENRKNVKFCDAIVILVGNEEVYIQKNVLSAASPYFRAIFNYSGSVIRDGKTVVDLSTLGIARDSFEAILDYVYTSSITLTTESIQDILMAADLLLLSDLKEICCEYLEQCVSPHNCLGIHDFSARYSCPWIHLKVTCYIDEHFREIGYSEEFLRLSEEILVNLLQRDTLNVRSEDDVLESIVRWHRFDPENRAPAVKSIVQKCIRSRQITEQSIQRLVENEDALDAAALVQCVRKMREENGDQRCRGLCPVIMFSGGEGNSSENEDEVEVKPFLRCVKPSLPGSSATVCHYVDMAPMLSSRSGHSLVEVGGCLYAAGGRDRSCRILNSAEKYDPLTDTWTAIAPMEHARVGFGLVAINDNIYAIGGSNDMTDPLTSMEVYNIFTNKWTSLPDIPLKRVWSAYASLDKKLFVIAGGIVGKFYESVECFDTRTHTWTSVSPMRERRCDARAVAVDDDIYVFGGFRRIECPSAVHSGNSLKFCGSEVYSPKLDNWCPIYSGGGSSRMCTMDASSHVDGALYNGEEIYVIGSLDVGSSHQCIRAYNKRTNSWRCCVQNEPPNQRSYQCALLMMPQATLRNLQWEQQKLTFLDLKQT